MKHLNIDGKGLYGICIGNLNKKEDNIIAYQVNFYTNMPGRDASHPPNAYVSKLIMP